MTNVIQINNQNFKEEVLNFEGLVLLDFYADWCQPCKLLSPELEKLAEDLKSYSNIKIAKVNAEQNPEISIKYKISGIPNVLLFKNGNDIDSLVGLRPREDYKKIILENLK